MKRTLILAMIFCATNTFSLSIPKKMVGLYKVEVPPFEFENNGHIVYASGYTLNIILKEEYMWYRTEMMELYGEYLDVKEEGDLIAVDAVISNDLSIKFGVDIVYNKKTGAIALKGLKGLPVLDMHKHEIGVKRSH